MSGKRTKSASQSADLKAQREYAERLFGEGGSDLEKQRAYVKEVEASGYDMNLVVAEAFVRGMRDVGYKNSAWALCEHVDNAIQAEAFNVHVTFDQKPKPAQLAIIDDGHGMDPEMLRLAVAWGGGHHGKDARGFGKYGFGLPTAAVALGRRYTVYSRVEGGDWNAVTIDLDDLQEGKLTKGHRIEVPDAEGAELPDWVASYVKRNFGRDSLSHGTVVVLGKLDRLQPKMGAALQNHLQEHFGTIYRNFIGTITIGVNGERTDAVDPLFLTPGYRYFDLEGDTDRAIELDPLAFDVTDRETGEKLGTVRVRYSRMPESFTRAPERKNDPKARGNNPRVRILDANNGLIIMREGRQIDVIRSKRDRKFFVNNDDRFWGVEIDFPPKLDEEFSITTSKQQIQLSDRIWDLLDKHGVLRTITEMRNAYDVERAERKAAAAADAEQKRTSEQVMEQAAKFKVRKPEGDEVKRREEAKQEFDREVKRRSTLSGVPEPEVERELESQQDGREYILETEALPGAPFYRPAQRGGSKVLYLNTAHRFYTKLYAEAEDPQVRAAVEVLLWVLAESEIEAGEERQEFYENERYEWSRRLQIALPLVEQVGGSTQAVGDSSAAREADAKSIA